MCGDYFLVAAFLVSISNETFVEENRCFFGGGYRRISPRSGNLVMINALLTKHRPERTSILSAPDKPTGLSRLYMPVDEGRKGRSIVAIKTKVHAVLIVEKGEKGPSGHAGSELRLGRGKVK